MSNKIESLVILYGLGFAILAIAIYLIAKAKASRKEKAEVKNIETISAIKGGESIQYPSSTTIKLQGTLKSSKQTQESAMKVANNSTYGAYGHTSNHGPSGMTSTPYANVEKVKSKPRPKTQPRFDDYVTDEDAGLVRKATSDGDFLTSMLVAEVTDSALLGTMVGGDPLGAMVGDMMNSDDDSHSSFDHDSSYYDSSFDNDSSSSSDSSDYSSSDSSSSDW